MKCKVSDSKSKIQETFFASKKQFLRNVKSGKAAGNSAKAVLNLNFATFGFTF